MSSIALKNYFQRWHVGFQTKCTLLHILFLTCFICCPTELEWVMKSALLLRSTYQTKKGIGSRNEPNMDSRQSQGWGYRRKGISGYWRCSRHSCGWSQLAKKSFGMNMDTSRSQRPLKTLNFLYWYLFEKTHEIPLDQPLGQFSSGCLKNPKLTKFYLAFWLITRDHQ